MWTITSGFAARLLLAMATLSSGLIAGFFYAYEVSVTRGLALVDDQTYVQTMQAINATVRNAPFAATFFGTLPLAALAALLLRRQRLRRPALLAAGGFALYGAAFLMTMGFSVPLNESLAVVDVSRTDLGEIRAGYEQEWNSWNLARTLCATAGFASLVGALGLTLGRQAQRASAVAGS
jgi:uncharacterized membrane protein